MAYLLIVFIASYGPNGSVSTDMSFHEFAVEEDCHKAATFAHVLAMEKHTSRKVSTECVAFRKATPPEAQNNPSEER